MYINLRYGMKKSAKKLPGHGKAIHDEFRALDDRRQRHRLRCAAKGICRQCGDTLADCRLLCAACRERKSLAAHQRRTLALWSLGAPMEQVAAMVIGPGVAPVRRRRRRRPLQSPLLVRCPACTATVALRSPAARCSCGCDPWPHVPRRLRAVWIHMSDAERLAALG